MEAGCPRSPSRCFLSTNLNRKAILLVAERLGRICWASLRQRRGLPRILLISLSGLREHFPVSLVKKKQKNKKELAWTREVSMSRTSPPLLLADHRRKAPVSASLGWSDMSSSQPSEPRNHLSSGAVCFQRGDKQGRFMVSGWEKGNVRESNHVSFTFSLSLVLPCTLFLSLSRG